MEDHLDTQKLRIVQLETLKLLQAQQQNLKELQVELERINSKIKNKEALSEEDSQYIGKLGWLSTLAMAIATMASSI